jgi:hypothetical protein
MASISQRNGSSAGVIINNVENIISIKQWRRKAYRKYRKAVNESWRNGNQRNGVM